jgi:hypothetical protein
MAGQSDIGVPGRGLLCGTRFLGLLDVRGLVFLLINGKIAERLLKCIRNNENGILLYE